MHSTHDHKNGQHVATTEVAAASPRSACIDRESTLENALAFWQPRTQRALTTEDARQIIQNMRGFFEVLDEWERSDRQATDGVL